MTVESESEAMGRSPLPSLRVHTDPPGGFVVDSDPGRIDLPRVHEWLSTDTYWATGRSFEAMRRAAEASVSFGVYDAEGSQVGYARVITDGVAFGWLCDVYIARSARGKGLGTALARTVVDAMRPLNLKRFMLATFDAHGVYRKAGFVLSPDPQRLMTLEAAPAEV